MRVTHGWYERDKDAAVFKNLSSVTIELGASEKWEMLLIISLFIQSQHDSGHECGVEFAKELQRLVKDDPNPDVPFLKEKIKELEEKNKKLLEG